MSCLPVSEHLPRDCRDKTRALTKLRDDLFSSVSDICMSDAVLLGSAFPAHKTNKENTDIESAQSDIEVCRFSFTRSTSGKSIFHVGLPGSSLSRVCRYDYVGPPRPGQAESTLVTASLPYSGVAPRHQ